MRRLMVLAVLLAGCGGEAGAGVDADSAALLPGVYAFHIDRAEVRGDAPSRAHVAIFVDGEEAARTSDSASLEFDETLEVPLHLGADLDFFLVGDGAPLIHLGWSEPVGDATLRRLLSGEIGERSWLKFTVEVVE